MKPFCLLLYVAEDNHFLQILVAYISHRHWIFGFEWLQDILVSIGDPAKTCETEAHNLALRLHCPLIYYLFQFRREPWLDLMIN
jgi:hypothetical protein